MTNLEHLKKEILEEFGKKYGDTLPYEARTFISQAIDSTAIKTKEALEIEDRWKEEKETKTTYSFGKKVGYMSAQKRFQDNWKAFKGNETAGKSDKTN